MIELKSVKENKVSFEEDLEKWNEVQKLNSKLLNDKVYKKIKEITSDLVYSKDFSDLYFELLNDVASQIDNKLENVIREAIGEINKTINQTKNL